MSSESACRCAAVPLVALLGVLLAGCSGSLRPGNTEDVELDTVAAVSDGAEVGAPALEVIDEASFAKVLEQNRGKVVLVDFWATWCGPCKELFPHTVELHKRFADRGLVVISVSLDDPDEDRTQVRKFLAGKKAAFDHFISRYGAGSRSFEVFAITNGALPHFKLYDHGGKLHKTFATGPQTIEPREIDRAVEELLKLM